MTSRCCKGLDALLAPSIRVGRTLVGIAPATKYLVLHVDNPQGLVEKAKGSGIAWAGMTLAPDFIVQQIYDQISSELKKQFKEKGSDVTVEIVETPPKGSKLSSDLFTGTVLGVLLVGLGYGAVKLASR